MLLATCQVEIELSNAGEAVVELVGLPVQAAGPLDLQNPMAGALLDALRAVLPAGTWIERVTAVPTVAPAGPGQTRDAAGIEGPGGINQAIGELAPREWAGMRFRSESEVHIAQALDRAGVLFLPGALARLGPHVGRHNREVDFLVCHEGMWGILEVDGELFHSGSRHEADRARDDLFRQGGVAIIRRYDAGRCSSMPDEVVAAFLDVLRSSVPR
jgi:hypothetical protein